MRYESNDTLSGVGHNALAAMYDHLFPGDIAISDGITFTIHDLNGTIPQFTLTCISTGGPATIVTWTRDSDAVTEGTQTVLDDQVNAQYNHTLTVTGRLGGLYKCTVANNKPSEDSIKLNIQGILCIETCIIILSPEYEIHITHIYTYTHRHTQTHTI